MRKVWSRSFRSILWVFLAFMASAPAHAGYGPRDYMDLHPAGWLSSKAVCVNDRGVVAGYGVTMAGERGFIWSGGRHTTLLPPGALSCTVSWMNLRGDVAGTAFDAEGTPHAFLYRDGAYVDPTPGWRYSKALYVGEDGAVTGSGDLGGFVAIDGRIEIPPTFLSVVGRTSTGVLLGSGDNVARMFVPGKGYLSLLPPGGDSATPGRVNDKGMATFSSPVQGVEKGYVYSGGFMIFMTPPSWTSSRAASINNHSEVAGTGDTPQGRKGFLRSGTEYEEIACPGWSATEAESVNDLGQVAGSGVDGSGETHAFLSSPASLSPASGDPGNGASVSAGGGCSMTPVGTAPVSASGICSLLLLLCPTAYPFARSLQRRAVTRR